jgi:ribosomal protein S18 acetylase RimI-like enzyme
MAPEAVPFVRRAFPTEMDAIQRLAAAVPEVAQWSQAAYEAYCSPEQNTPASAKALFVACVRRGCAQIVIGFAAFSAAGFPDGAECELDNMAVEPSWRRQGIGRRLLNAGMLWRCTWQASAGAAGQNDNRLIELQPDVKLYLEVRISNQSAIAFYESSGFKAYGRRPGYYSNPSEDAVLMKCTRCPGSSPTEIPVENSIANR